MDSLVNTAAETTSFSQGNIDAIMKAGQIWAAGCQAFSRTVAATAQAQVGQTVSTWKAMVGVKTLNEAVDLQTNYARAVVGTCLAGTRKLTEDSLKLVEQTMAPITSRMTPSVEKV